MNAKQLPAQKVALYVRVSSEEQKQNNSVDAQLYALKQYVEQNKDRYAFDPSLVYSDEAVSGSTHYTIRPGLMKLYKDITPKNIQTILIVRIDRLSRSLQSLLEFIDKAGDKGASIQFLDFPEISNPAMLKVMVSMCGTMAELERNLNLQRSAEGRMAAADKGKWLGGEMKYGFDADENNIIIKHPEEYTYIQKLFLDFDEGNWNINEYAKRMAETPWEKHRKKTDRTFSPGILIFNPKLMRSYLTDPAYMGKYYYGKKKTVTDSMGRKKEKVVRSIDEMICISVPAIIEEDLFQRVQDKIKKQDAINKRLLKEKRKNEKETLYLFSSKIICSGCLKKYTGKTSSKNTAQYQHRKRIVEGKSITCSVKRCSISEFIIKETVIKKVLMNILQQAKASLVKRVIECITKNNKDAEWVLKSIQRNTVRKESLIREKQKLQEYMRKNNTNYADSLEMNDVIDNKISDIEEKTRVHTENYKALMEGDNPVHILADVEELYDQQLKTPSPEFIQLIVDAFIEKISISDQKIDVYITFYKG